MQSEEEVRAYLLGLKPGERVIETTRSCMYRKQGTVYISERGSSKDHVYVRWDPDEDGGVMSTSVTWGTRRLCDADLC